MKLRGALILLLLMGSSVWGAREVRVYLNPSVAAAGALTLGDVARVDADDADSLAALPLDASVYADGFIDSGEIRAAVSGRTTGLLRIFGTAIRVRPPEIRGETDAIPVIGESAVKNGDRVDVMVRKNGIVIRAAGTALAEGNVGDRVFIRTGNSRRIRGVIAGRGLVEVNL